MFKSRHTNAHLRRITGAALVGGLMATLSGAASATCDSSGTTGEICLMATTFCPVGTLEAAGQSLSIMDYQALYTLLGTTYGGNGTSNFNLPDLRGRVPVGVGTGTNLSPVTLGQQRGVEDVDLPDGGYASADTKRSEKLAVAAPKEVAVLNPQLGLRFCIITNGMYPMRR
jgi:microcystin-dependent protein